MRETSGCKFLTPMIASMVALMLGACATVPRTELVIAEQSRDCVVLLHGLNRSYRAMSKMASELQEAGYSTANVDYPSQAATVEGLAKMAVNEGLDKCRKTNAEHIHFVTHSIGGILLRYAQSVSPIPELNRVVMLAPPNQGSEVVDITRNWPTAELISGHAGLQLGTGEDGIAAKLGPVDFELGVVAGTGTINPFFSVMLPYPNDGKVSVESTMVEGMKDFLVVRRSHRYIMTSDTVIENTKNFLKDGRFLTSTDPDSVAFEPDSRLDR
jgi:triacylglycerol lipase